MSDSPLKFLRAGPPPPKVSLLPDALFFTRAIPIAPDTPAADVAAQVELALESLAPFPVAQLYHGYYFPPGATAALVFASYRRRFTAEQTELWFDADLVLPTFAAVLGAPLDPGGISSASSAGSSLIAAKAATLNDPSGWRSAWAWSSMAMTAKQLCTKASMRSSMPLRIG